MSSFQKDFDTLFAAILTDWQNQYPEADLSEGSLIYIKSACLASALWGLYKYQDWICKQIFPDTADTQYMEHHAWVRGISRNTGETDSAYLSRLLDYIRRPPAGGNKYDYVKWAREIDGVAAAYCIPLSRGLGTVDVIIIADESTTGSELPSDYENLTGTVTSVSAGKLVDSTADFTNAATKVAPGDIGINTDTGGEAVVVTVDSATELTLSADIFTDVGQAYRVKSLTEQTLEYIDDVRPVTASSVVVLGPTITTVNVAVTVTGEVNKPQVESEISAYMNTLIPGETLYISRIIAIAIEEGATNAVVTAPAADVTADATEILRPGTITVT